MGCRTIAVGILLAVGASSQTNQAPNRPPASRRLEQGREFLGLGAPPDAAAAALGQKLFVTNCSFCHGANATGAEGPNLLRSSTVLHDDKGELIGPVIHNGRADKGMPAFANFTPEQLDDLAEFLHQRVYDATNRWGYKVGNIVTGNASEGQQYFAQHCATCHSASGDLAHIASKYQPTELQQLFLYPGSLLHLPVSVTVDVKGGDEIKGTLMAQDDFSIIVREDSGRVAAWQTDQIKFQIHDPYASHLDMLPHYSNADMHNILAYLVTLK